MLQERGVWYLYDDETVLHVQRGMSGWEKPIALVDINKGQKDRAASRRLVWA